MATGTPVIATRTDGPVEILAHGSTGWLFPVDDREALRDLIRRTFEDPANRARVGERGMIDVERRFRAEAAAETIERALSDLLGGNPNAGVTKHPDTDTSHTGDSADR